MLTAFLIIPEWKCKRFAQRSSLQNQHRNQKLCLGDVWSGWRQIQNLTYKTPQLYKDYGTLQTHPHLPPSIWEQKLKNETKHLWLSGSGSHRKTGKDWTPQLWSSTLSLLQKNCSLLPHVTWVCLRGTWVLLGRKAEQGKPCGYSCRLQRQDSQAPIACDVSCSNTEVGQEERRCTEVKCFISLDKIHTLFYTPAFLCEHKDTETRMFVSVFSNTSNFPILC